MSGRWTDLVRSVAGHVVFHAPAEDASLQSCEEHLGHPLAADLRALLRETDGLDLDDGDSPFLWDLAQIVVDNDWVRRFESYPDGCVPVAEICFFAGAGEGSWFGFVPKREAHDLHDIYVWSPAAGELTWVAPDLERFVRGWVDGDITI